MHQRSDNSIDASENSLLDDNNEVINIHFIPWYDQYMIEICMRNNT